MSLTMLALRVCAVEALKAGNTLVGSNVLDSEIAALDHTVDGALTSDQQRPFIAVYTEASKADGLASSGLRKNGLIDLLFNFGISMGMCSTDRGTGETLTELGLPATDAQFEAELDIIGAQICRVLQDENNPWSVTFLGFVNSMVSRREQRGGGGADGIRLAAGQIRISIEAIADPAPGLSLASEGPWSAFQDQLRAAGHPYEAILAPLLAETPVGLYPDFQSLMGMPPRISGALSLHPMPGLTRAAVLKDLAVDE